MKKHKQVFFLSKISDTRLIIMLNIYYNRNIKGGTKMKVRKKFFAAFVSAIMFLVCIQPMIQRVEGCDDQWVGAWSTSPVEFNIKKLIGLECIKKESGLKYLTFRTRLQPTVSGSSMRLTLSNTFGTGTVTVDAMTVAKGNSKNAQKIELKTKKNVTVNGSKKISIGKGETVTTDPINLSVEALEYVTVTIYMKNTDHLKTFGLIGGDTYISSGNQTGFLTTLGVPMKLNGDFGEYNVIPLLSQLEVCHPQAKATVIIGDSTVANDIPILLAEKLKNNGIDNVGILQQAIKGNRLMADGAGALGMLYGESVLKRFDRDVLQMSNVDTVIIKVGCNDIIHPRCQSMQGLAPLVSVEEMIDGYKQLIEKAHQAGIQVYLMTRTAWKGYTRNILNSGDDIEWTEDIDQMRVEINNWIKSAENPADGYIDLDDLCQDQQATQLKDEYTTDGVHLTLAGQKALVDDIPLEIWK